MWIAGVTPEFHGAMYSDSVTPIPGPLAYGLSRKQLYCNSFGTKLLKIPGRLALQLRLQDLPWKQNHLCSLR